MKRSLALALCLLLLAVPFSPALAAGDTPSAPSGISLPDLEDFVDSYAARYIGETSSGTAVAVWADGELVLNKTYGVNDTQTGTPVDTADVFEWGSASKLLVWTSVMQMYERGLLDLEADIRTYLPEGFLSNLHYDVPITIYNLMHHNAGWEERYTNLFYHAPGQVSSLEEELRIGEPHQVNAPGEVVVAYSNYGTALAAYLVELAAGQPFYDYVQDNIVQENIFSVLGMADTTLHPTQADNAAVLDRREQIKGHVVTGGALAVAPNERIYIGLYPAGSATGTFADAMKFLAALMPG